MRARRLLLGLALLAAACTPYLPPDDPSTVQTSLSMDNPGVHGTLYLDGSRIDFGAGLNSVASLSNALQSHELRFEPAPGFAFEDFWVMEQSSSSLVHTNPMVIEMRKTSLEVGVDVSSLP